MVTAATLEVTLPRRVARLAGPFTVENRTSVAPFDVYAYRAYTGSVSIEFDPKKDAANLKKHGVSLSEGDGVLNDPLALTLEDKSAEGEQRFVTVGMNVFGSLMVVVHTPSGENVRIISVRRADPKERRNYEKGV
jgi:uncharacterized DUF497 family protein